jgi:signal transduction histidine kinase
MSSGNTSFLKRGKRTRHRWHYLYYLLAAFNLLTMTYSMYLNSKMHAAFNESVSYGQKWHARFEGFNELLDLAMRIKVPMDRLFQTGDVGRARSDMHVANLRFNNHLGERLRDLTEEAELIKAETLLSRVGEARQSINKVTDLAELLFKEYGKVDVAASAVSKAEIDSEMQRFYGTVGGIIQQIGQIQMRSFEQQLEYSERLQRGMYFVVGLIVVMVILAVIAGGRITNRMDRDSEDLDEAHRQLVDTARQAGMAEIATGVLHNVGNVLNSVNVSATLVADRLKKSRLGSVSRVAELLEQNGGRLGEFLTIDEKGKQVPAFIKTLGGHLERERDEILEELTSLNKSIQHIKGIISMQQSYAKVTGVSETCAVGEVLEDAIRLNAVSLQRHDIELIRDFDAKIDVTIERHKVLQIMVNLMRNAKEALDKADGREKKMILRVERCGEDRFAVSVIDNGIGIGEETMKKLFQHGFTTRKEGHGFGLHSGALAAKEMGGALTVTSAGEGSGATFRLELPVEPPPPQS